MATIATKWRRKKKGKKKKGFQNGGEVRIGEKKWKKIISKQPKWPHPPICALMVVGSQLLAYSWMWKRFGACLWNTIYYNGNHWKKSGFYI
jgi:hypothetical protein